MKNEASLVGNAFVYTLLVQVQTLEFTILYNTMSRGRGGGDWKAAFLKRAFQTSDEYKHVFADLTNAQKDAKMRTMGDEYREWARASQEKVTRRNRLLSMYKLVSVSNCARRVRERCLQTTVWVRVRVRG
jgi:hypothetical protein